MSRAAPYPLPLSVRALLADAFGAWVQLLKVLVPALLAVKALEALGGVDALGVFLAPVLSPLGLPEWAGVVWAATLLTNIFTGMVLLLEFAGDAPLSVEQTSVLGTLMLVCHSLPVEGAVARRAGVPWHVTIALRVGGALVLAWLIHAVHLMTGRSQGPARIAWRPAAGDGGLAGWALSQLVTLATIFVVILVLMALLRVLRRLGVERLMHLALAPLLRALGIGRTACNVTVIGVVLGLTYGAGLVIRDVDSGTMSARDSFLALCFLGLVHSIVEDTLLIVALGADLHAILWPRLALSIAVIAVLGRCLPAPAARPTPTRRP